MNAKATSDDTEFVWREEYAIGDPEIDADHRHVFQMIRLLETADRSDGFLADMIGRLEEHGERHFVDEEAKMRAAGYPDLERHIEEHKAFVEWLDSVKITYRRAAESPFEVGDLVNEFLKTWARRHLLGSDLKFREFLQEKKGA